MTITQTVEIPASRRLTIDLPCEIPVGRVILAFTPAAEPKAADDDGLYPDGECPICAANRDPVTGEERFNAETIAAFEEGDAILRGEIPAKWYKSFDEMWKDLTAEDGLSESDD
jgi:hypothetical protein